MKGQCKGSRNQKSLSAAGSVAPPHPFGSAGGAATVGSTTAPQYDNNTGKNHVLRLSPNLARRKDEHNIRQAPAQRVKKRED